jgi:glucose uptake protein GlcU
LSIIIDEYYSSRELIVGCLAVSMLCIFSVWTTYKNDGEMGETTYDNHCKSIESLARTTNVACCSDYNV